MRGRFDGYALLFGIFFDPSYIGEHFVPSRSSRRTTSGSWTTSSPARSRPPACTSWRSRSCSEDARTSAWCSTWKARYYEEFGVERGFSPSTTSSRRTTRMAGSSSRSSSREGPPLPSGWHWGKDEKNAAASGDLAAVLKANGGIFQPYHRGIGNVCNEQPGTWHLRRHRFPQSHAFFSPLLGDFDASGTCGCLIAKPRAQPAKSAPDPQKTKNRSCPVRGSPRSES